MPKLIWIGSTAKFDVRADGEGQRFPRTLKSDAQLTCGALSLNLKVTTIANREIVSVEAESTVEEAAKVMASRNIGAVAVRKGGEIVGIMTERDVLKRVVAAGGTRGRRGSRR